MGAASQKALNHKQCIYCRSSFAKASREHILQNFLGARWAVEHIVCNHCQNNFGQTIDRAFEQGVRPIRTMLGTEGGRGGFGQPLRDMETTAGERVHIDPGGVPRFTRPKLEIGEASDGRRKVRITLGSADQFEWALAELRKEIPEGKILEDEETLRKSMRPVENYLEGALKMRIEIGGMDFLRGLVKSAFNLLAAHSRDGLNAALSPEFDGVRKFVLRGEGETHRFVRWSTDADIRKFYSTGVLGHALGLVTRGHCVEGIIQIFGHISFPLRLSDSYGGMPISCGYVVDPFREAKPAEKRLSDFPSSAAPLFADQHLEINAQTQEVYEDQVKRIEREFYERARDRIIDEALQEVLGQSSGQPLTEEMRNLLVRRFVERLYLPQLVRRERFQSDYPR